MIRSPLASLPSHGPRLLADVGGTNARFSIEVDSGSFEAILVLSCKDYLSLQDAILVYLATPAARAAGSALIRDAVIAIANPVNGDCIAMTNHSWSFSIESMRVALALDTLLVVNDFTALAMALPLLTPCQRFAVGGGVARNDCTIGLIGAGTGLGVSGLVWAGERWNALATEGGHVTFSPSDEREIEVLRFARQEWSHVSAERLLSGAGLELIYRALASKEEKDVEPLHASEITTRALDSSDRFCNEAVELFCSMLGTLAGNVALTLGAQGGIYIGGGIVPRLGELFAMSQFRNRFEQKGRFSDYLSRIPTYVITAEFPAFLGASAILTEHLKTKCRGAIPERRPRSAAG